MRLSINFINIVFMFREEDYEFLSFIWKLKWVTRYHWKFWDDYGISRKESVSDHTWRMALMLCYFQNKIELSYNFEKAMKMVLIHDVPEIVAGDVPLMHSLRWNKEFENEKTLKEIDAMNWICNTQISQEFLELFKEHEEQITNEAIIVKYLDRIEWIMQVYEYRKWDMLPEHFELSLKRWQTPYWKDNFLDEVKDFLIEKVTKSYQKLKNNWKSIL